VELVASDKLCSFDRCEIGPKLTQRNVDRIGAESDQSRIFAKGLSERQESWMLAFVLRDDTATRLMLQKPKKGKQFTEDGDAAAEWSAPDRPTACDEFIEFRESGYSVPEPVPCCKSNVPDVARDNGHGTERARFERGPESVASIVARPQLPQHIKLGMGDGRRSKPSWRCFRVRPAISSNSNNTSVRISQNRANSYVAADVSFPRECDCRPPRLFQR
jgi:hypothetical protein